MKLPEMIIILTIWIITPIMAWIWYGWRLAILFIAFDTVMTRWAKDQFIRKDKA